jgi:hypothetical protein
VEAAHRGECACTVQCAWDCGSEWSGSSEDEVMSVRESAR